MYEPREMGRKGDYCRYLRFCTMRRYIRARHRAISVTLHTPRHCNSLHRPTCSPDTRLSNRLPEYTARTCSSDTTAFYIWTFPFSLSTCWTWRLFHVEDETNSSTEKGIIDLGRHWNPEGRPCDGRETARNLKKGSGENNVETAIGGEVPRTYTFDTWVCRYVCKSWDIYQYMPQLPAIPSMCATSDSFTSTS